MSTATPSSEPTIPVQPRMYKRPFTGRWATHLWLVEYDPDVTTYNHDVLYTVDDVEQPKFWVKMKLDLNYTDESLSEPHVCVVPALTPIEYESGTYAIRGQQRFSILNLKGFPLVQTESKPEGVLSGPHPLCYILLPTKEFYERIGSVLIGGTFILRMKSEFKKGEIVDPEASGEENVDTSAEEDTDYVLQGI